MMNEIPIYLKGKTKDNESIEVKFNCSIDVDSGDIKRYIYPEVSTIVLSNGDVIAAEDNQEMEEIAIDLMGKTQYEDLKSKAHHEAYVHYISE